MANYDCFFIEPTDQVRQFLRRFKYGKNCLCPLPHGYHDASVHIGDQKSDGQELHGDTHPHSDPRWPTHCACGYEFDRLDEWQYSPTVLYKRADTGELFTLREAPVGAIWRATWLEDRSFKGYCGPDGRSYVVRMPGNHDWMIDGRASNCTMPTDHEHKCWVRHGEAPKLTVDKNGKTCAAGAGSIIVPGWHGFLTNGQLREC